MKFKQYYTVAEAAALGYRSKKWFYVAIKTGRISARKDAHRFVINRHDMKRVFAGEIKIRRRDVGL